MIFCLVIACLYSIFRLCESQMSTFVFFIIFIIVVIILIVMLYCNVIIYMKKLLNSDWLRREWKMCNTSAKCVIQCKVHNEILEYDWLMNRRVWSGPMKSFVFKLSPCPGWHNLWCNFSLIA